MKTINWNAFIANFCLGFFLCALYDTDPLDWRFWIIAVLIGWYGYECEKEGKESE